MTVRTRFAPSPTGFLHIGGVRTALFSWLFARHRGGVFILRIEDTDTERSTPESVEAILDGMAWLGLDYDEGPYYQSKRFDRYREVVDHLLAEGKAYHCYCSREELEAMRLEQRARGIKPRYDRRCRHRSGPPPTDVPPVVRFRNPDEGVVVFDDRVRGRVGIANNELDDLIIARSDGSPTYNFTVVVDDLDMAVTHVIRGDDHVNNTPRQINILKALGGEIPVYAHVPMILGPDGQRLSKRHGAVSVLEYRDQGVLAEALRNYLVRLGWSRGDQEIFTVEEMIEFFDIDEVNRASASFDPEKLNWYNQYYIRLADSRRLESLLREQLERRGADVGAGPPLGAVVEALRERAVTMADMADKAMYLFADIGDYDDHAARKHLRPAAMAPMRALRERLAAESDWSAPSIHRQFETVTEQFGINYGKIAQPVRVALSGSAATPPIDVTVALVGRERTLSRLDRALDFIAARAAAEG